MKAFNEISVYHNYSKPVPAGNKPIIAFINDVMNGTYKTEVEAVRQATDKEARNKIKSTLPAVTISGTFTVRSNTSLIQHSGFICIDVDTKPENVTWIEIRDTCGSWDNVFFSALSVSGEGVFLIIPIQSPHKHRQHFEALSREFGHIKLPIDISCKDVSRLRGMSYDPDAIFNPEAVDYDRIYDIPPPATAHKPRIKDTLNGNRIPITKLHEYVEQDYGIMFMPKFRHPFIVHLVSKCISHGYAQHEIETELIQYEQETFHGSEIKKIIKDMYATKR